MSLADKVREKLSQTSMIYHCDNANAKLEALHEALAQAVSALSDIESCMQNYSKFGAEGTIAANISRANLALDAIEQALLGYSSTSSAIKAAPLCAKHSCCLPAGYSSTLTGPDECVTCRAML